MFIIRADGNAKIGAGHLMRCLTIAEAVRNCLDAPEILVLCADEDSAKLALDRGFWAKALHTDYRNMEEELPLWNRWIKDEKNIILVDSYHVTEQYLVGLRSFGKVCLMDDMQKHAYPVDTVINYNVFADEAVYWRLYDQTCKGTCREYVDTKFGSVRFCLGGAYVPLRQQFQDVSYCVKDKVEQVLITTGAGDADNIAGAILDRVYREDIRYHVLVGRFSPHLKDWQERAANVSNILVYFDVQDMAGLMKQCDLAISAGGSTVYELSAVGVPFISFAYAQNQELLVEYLGAHDVAGSAGEWHKDKDNALEQIESLFERFCADLDLRKNYAKKAHELVDGKGAERLARILCMKETGL